MDRHQRARTSSSPTAAAAAVASLSMRSSTSRTPHLRLVEQVRQTQSRLRVGRGFRGLISTSR